MIFRRSPNVPVLNDYRACRDAYLRPDFRYRCAYCLTHEFYFLTFAPGPADPPQPLRFERAGSTLGESRESRELLVVPVTDVAARTPRAASPRTA